MVTTPSNASGRTSSVRAGDLSDAAADVQRAASAGVESLRQAVGEDLRHGREWVERKTHETRLAIQDDPQRATIYALGIGVLIGLLMRR